MRKTDIKLHARQTFMITSCDCHSSHTQDDVNYLYHINIEIIIYFFNALATTTHCLTICDLYYLTIMSTAESEVFHGVQLWHGGEPLIIPRCVKRS